MRAASLLAVAALAVALGACALIVGFPDLPNLPDASPDARSDAPAESSCDYCGSFDGGKAPYLIFSSHFENNDDVTRGSPCGCNTNADKTWTRSGITYSNTQHTDGTYSFLRNGTSQYASISTDTSARAAKVIFRLYATSASPSTPHILWYLDANDYISIGAAPALLFDDGGAVSNSYSEALSYHVGPNSSIVTTPAGELSLNTWHTITAQWIATGAIPPSDYLSIQVDNNDGAAVFGITLTPLDFFEKNNMPGLWVGAPSTPPFPLNTDIFYIDNLEVYSTFDIVDAGIVDIVDAGPPPIFDAGG